MNNHLSISFFKIYFGSGSLIAVYRLHLVAANSGRGAVGRAILVEVVVDRLLIGVASHIAACGWASVVAAPRL